MKKVVPAIVFIVLACATCVGQTSYKGLTPGRSTRADAERVLGRPVKEVSRTLVEYRSPGESGRLFVQYGDEPAAAVVERVELTCSAKMGAGAGCDKLSEPLMYVEFDARVVAREEGPNGQARATVYFGAPRFIRFMEAWKPGDEFEYRLAFFSQELYEATAPKGGCTGTIFGTWENPPTYANHPGYFNLGRVTIERVGDDGIRGVYQKNNGTLTLKRAWQGDENFLHGRRKFKGEWKDDTGGGTIEIEVGHSGESMSAKIKRISGRPQPKEPIPSTDPTRQMIEAISPNWRGQCVP